jgi:hypothetical protein
VVGADGLPAKTGVLVVQRVDERHLADAGTARDARSNREPGLDVGRAVDLDVDVRCDEQVVGVRATQVRSAVSPPAVQYPQIRQEPGSPVVPLGLPGQQCPVEGRSVHQPASP